MQPDDVDEPIDHFAVRRSRKGHPIDPAEGALVGGGDPGPTGAQFGQALKLGHAYRGRDLIEAVVVPQSDVTEPRTVAIAPLIAEATHSLDQLGVIGHDHPALSRRDLFVWVEGEHTDITEATERPAVHRRTETFTSILDQFPPTPLGRCFDSLDLAWPPEHVHWQDRLSPARGCSLDEIRIDSQTVFL